MRSAHRIPLIGFFAICTLAGTATAGEKFHAELSGAQEVPAVSTAGKGTLHLEVADDESSIEFHLTYSDLEGGVAGAVGAAHIHFGQAGVNGGVSTFLCGGPMRPACPASPSSPSSAHVSGTIVATDVVGPTGQGIAPGQLGELLRAIRAGLAYVNVHDAGFPGGEIRGQIE